MNLFYKNEGAVTVFLIFILIPMLLFAGVAVDFVRVNSAKTTISGAGDLAINAGLASYDQTIKEIYGLFAISATEEELTDNLIKYFDSTINALGINYDEEDSYTKDIIESIKNMLQSPGELEYSNLTNITLKSFSAGGVLNSELYRPQVVKRQIIEYMKYRAPISLGTNFLEKVNLIGEVPKQQKVIEDKVQYETQLENIQDMMELAYKQIKEYTELVKILEGNSEYDRHCINDACAILEGEYGIGFINKLLIAGYKNTGLIVNYNDNNIEDTYEAAKSYLNLLQNEHSEEKIDDILNFLGKYKDYSGEDEIIKYFYKIKSKAQKIYDITKNYDVFTDKFDEYYNSLAEKDKNHEDDEDYETAAVEAEAEHDLIVGKLSEKIDDLKEHITLFNEKNKYFKDEINITMTAINNKLCDKYDLVKSIVVKCDTIIISLNGIVSGCETAIQKGENWDKSIGNLSDGSTKESMRAQYSKIAESIDKDVVKELINIIETNKSYYEACMRDFEAIKYLDHQIASIRNAADTNSLSNKASPINFSTANEAINYANNTLGQNLDKPLSWQSLNIGRTKHDNVQFYLYLKKNVRKEPLNENDKKAQTSGETHKKNILEEVNKKVNEYDEVKKSLSLENTTGKIDVLDDDLPSNLIMVYYDEKNPENAPLMNNEKKSSEMAMESTKMMESGTKLLNGIANLADGIGEEVRDELYVTEYISEMFSCFTAKEGKEKTLSGFPINAENNALYKCEMEYMLWGKQGDDIKNNVYSTLAVILGIRFVLNTMYAYTDAEIQAIVNSIALAVAGWTGFGVPIVKTVLILALSLGEAAWDVVDLANGENVVIYKTKTTWMLKPSSIATEVAEQIKINTIDATKEALGKIIDNTYDSIEKLAEDYTDENIQEMEDNFDKLAEGLADDLASSISDCILTPFQNDITTFITLAKNGAASELENQFSQISDNIRADLLKEPEGLAKEIKLKIFDEFISSDTYSDIQNSVIESLNKIANDTAASLSEINISIANKISEASYSLYAKAKNAINLSQKYEDLKIKVKDNLRKGKDNLKNRVTGAIDNFSAEFSTNKKGESATLNNDSYSSNASSISLTLNYKEYVKIFILSNLLVDSEDKMLVRMCDLIKINTKLANKDSDFLWKNSYTMIGVSADSTVKTTFMKNSIFHKDKAEHAEYEDYLIKYNGIYGY